MCLPSSLTRTARFVFWLEQQALTVLFMCATFAGAFYLDKCFFETAVWYFGAGFITCKYDTYRKSI